MELNCIALPLPPGNAIYRTTGPKTRPLALPSTLEASHLTRKRREDTTQKLLLGLIFLQSCENAFNTVHGLNFGCQLGTHQNTGVNIKIINIGVYFNSKGPLSQTGTQVEDREGETGNEERQKGLDI